MCLKFNFTDLHDGDIKLFKKEKKLFYLKPDAVIEVNSSQEKIEQVLRGCLG